MLQRKLKMSPENPKDPGHDEENLERIGKIGILYILNLNILLRHWFYCFWINEMV